MESFYQPPGKTCFTWQQLPVTRGERLFSFLVRIHARGINRRHKFRLTEMAAKAKKPGVEEA
jgi:hypothetical protein